MRSSVLYMALLPLTMFIGCREDLPLRNDPELMFTRSVGHTYDVFYPRNPDVRRNQILLNFYAASHYDEVITDRADVTGTVTIRWIVPEGGAGATNERIRTIPLTAAHIAKAAGFDRLTGEWDLFPEDTIIVTCAWDLRLNDSSHIASITSHRLDTRCQVYYAPDQVAYRKVTVQQKFSVTANIRFTKLTSMQQFGPYDFTQCFIVPYYAPMRQLDGHDCISESHIDPCLLVE